jgi:hypothetical protein
MIKYRTRWETIVKVEVERETESCVWIKGRRNNKKSGWENFFDTWQEAHAFVIQNAEEKVFNIVNELARAKHELEKIKGMNP